MAEERGLAMDEESFERAKQKSLEVSKSSGKVLDGDVVQLDVHDLGMLEGMEDVPKTKDDAKYGTHQPSGIRSDHSLLSFLVEAILSSTIKAIYQNNKFVHNSSLLEHGTAFGLLLDHTNFYAEAGGQQHDTGLITIEGTAHFAVIDVRVYNGYVIHVGHLKAGQLRVGDEATCMVDQVSRILDIHHRTVIRVRIAGPAMQTANEPHRNPSPQSRAARNPR
jgi:alanyl-tRNA synthetase